MSRHEKPWQREIDVLRMLRHPNLIQYFSCLDLADEIYLFMEYAEGQTLTTLMRARELKISEIQFILAQLVSGLTYLHDMGIAH